MKHIEIKGARVPALGLGTWQLGGRTCREAVRQALELGYRHIDTAQMYGNETDIGRALRDSGIARKELFLTTKLAPGNLGAAMVRRTAEESLKRLGVEQVDLLLIHWPSGEAPLGETLAALAKLREERKARFIGVSNFNVKLLKEAVETHGADLLCNQVEYHPFLSQRAVMAALRRYGLMLTAYTPLGRGHVQHNRALAAIGAKYGKSAAQVALRWLIEQENVAAIPKAASRAHAAANIDIFDFTLAAEDRAAIDAMRGTLRVVDPGWGPEWDPP
ncbi:MAG TPA: aldo/keto reductase [Stellaceae bacterium]|nr:aldo/keto reductase [Stellaceae bacterium]